MLIQFLHTRYSLARQDGLLPESYDILGAHLLFLAPVELPGPYYYFDMFIIYALEHTHAQMQVGPPQLQTTGANNGACSECRQRLEVCNRVAGVDYDKFAAEIQRLHDDAHFMTKLASNTTEALKARRPVVEGALQGPRLFAAFQKRPRAGPPEPNRASLPERTALALSKKYQILGSKIKLLELQAASVTRKLHKDLETERELHKDTADQLQSLLQKLSKTERARASLEAQLKSKTDELQLMRAHLENLSRNNNVSHWNSNDRSHRQSNNGIKGNGSQLYRITTKRDILGRHAQRSLRL